MTRYRVSLVVALLSAAAVSIGAQDGALEPADGLENWKHSIDLDKYAPGKYNLVVEGRDKAGNVTRAAPMNIYVDPKAGVPEISIINPIPLMRVGGDLNIVGTCVCSEKIDKIEVRLDGGEFRQAEGDEFWSLFLKTADIPEGRRTIEVRGTDAKGRVGPVAKVKFDLDRTKPAATVASPAMGSLVAGQVRIRGSVYDANGVRSLEISREGTEAWARVPIKKGKDQTRAAFTWLIDTRKLKDGPNVFSLRSVDMVGSTSTMPYLVFVENSKPELLLARPTADAPIHGKLVIAGTARSAVGIKRLTYQFGPSERGEIPLTKGDPFFVAEVDASTIKGDSVAVVLVAEDEIGNRTRLAKSFKIAHKADRPVLKVLGPAPLPAPSGSKRSAGSLALREGEAIWGSVYDYDGVKAFRWSLDGGSPTEVPCSEVFALPMPAASSGRHTLSLAPINSKGIVGDPVLLSISLDKGPGSVSFDRLATLKASRDFVPGIEVAVDGGEFLEGSFSAPNPLVSAEYAIAGGKRLPLALVKASGVAAGVAPGVRFRIPINASLPYGFAPVSVEAKDQAGNVIRSEALLYVADYAIAREEAGFRFVDPRVGDDGRVPLGRMPLSGAFYGGELASLRLDPPTDIVAASFDGRVVWITPAKEGTTAPTRILGKTKQGREFASAPMVFVTDSTPPVLDLDSPAEGVRFGGKLVFKGRATNAVGPAVLAWRLLPEGEEKSVPLAKDGSFSFELSAADFPAGPLSIELEARNPAGLVSRVYRGLVADAKGPEVAFLAPEKGAEVWGPEDVAARIDSASGIKSVEFAPDGKSFAPIEWKGIYFAHRADFAGNPSAAYRVTDLAGNSAVFKPEVNVVPAPVRPSASPTVSVEAADGEAKVELSGTAGGLKASLSLPALAEAGFAALGARDAPPPARFASRFLVPGALSLKGQASVGGKAKAVSLSLDDGATWSPLAAYKDEKSAKPALPFALSLEAAKLADGLGRIELKVEDFDGGVFFCPIYLLVDTKAPALSLVYPEQGKTAMPGPFPLVIKAEDENGIASGELALGAAKESLDPASTGRYIVRMVDPPAGPKAAAVAASLVARDQAGNKAALGLRFGYDSAGAAPKLSEDSLAAEPGGLVSGLATAFDGPRGVKAAIDGGESLSFPAGAYAFALSDLAAGKHVLSLEIDGQAVPVKREFSMKGPAPTLGDFRIVSGKDSVACAPGAEIRIASGGSFAGSVSSPNGTRGVSVSFNGGPKAVAALAKAAPGSPQSFSIPVPALLPYGRVTIEVEGKDLSGQSVLQRIEIHKVLPAAAGSDDDEGIRFADPRVSQDGGKYSFVLAPGDKLVGRFNGRPVRSVAISPASSFIEAAFDGQLVSIAAKAEGLAPDSSLELTTVDGDVFRWGPFAAAVNSGPPAIELSSPTDHDWIKGEVRVAGSASSPQGIASLKVSLNDGEPEVLLDLPTVAKDKATFDKVVSLASVPDGATRVEIIAVDGAGRESRLSRFVNKDTVPPTVTQVLPAPGESVNGLTTFLCETADGGRLALASFLRPAGQSGTGVGASAGAETVEPPASAAPSEAPDWIDRLRANRSASQTPASQAPVSKGPAPISIVSEDVQGRNYLWHDLDLTKLDMPLAEGCGFVVTDKAGNRTVFAPTVTVDKEKDKPVAEIDSPAEMEVLRGDFVISGVAFDDDGLAAAYYRIDGGEWNRIGMQGPSFSIPIALKDTTDNEHTVEVKAEDIYGVQGDVVSRTYRISKEEPQATMTSPSIAKPVRGTVKLEGTASDANGIKEVTVSVDNRTSFDMPVGADSWSLSLDTTTLSDGIHAVAVRPVDKYDTEGFYASMITVDNTPPKAQMDLPRDGEEEAGTLFVSGRISDNLSIASSRIEVAPIGENQPPALVVELGTGKIVQSSIDVSGLKNGEYAVRLVVRDRADNESMASRTVEVVAPAPRDSVSILFPMEGARLAGKLRVQGRASVASGAQTVTVLSDGSVLGTAEPDGLGWYSLEVSANALSDGDHVLRARTSDKAGRAIESADTRVQWRNLGPWISIDSFPSGKYLPYRPYLKGKAGWAAEGPAAGGKKEMAEYRKAAKSRAIAQVDVSLDDGKSFAPAKGRENWSFRLETQDFKDGPLHVIARVRYADGTVADAKVLYFLDKTPPEVEILAPTEGGRFNGNLDVEGRSFDDNGMSSVDVGLRKGDKSRYEVPSFIQGLYVDGQMLGATTWMTGAGLTFFGDNVKLEACYGQAPTVDPTTGEDESFYGAVVGGKIIANVAYLPFDSMFGPDWDFLSASLGLGASFDYFSKTQAGDGLVVGSVFAQLEFPKITLKNRSAFKKVSFYTEYELWVLSSIVDGGFIPKLSFGARIGIF